MVAGGGASVIYSDTICALGGSEELANYGEYSGAPSEQQTYDYAKTILSLMTRYTFKTIFVYQGDLIDHILDVH